MSVLYLIAALTGWIVRLAAMIIVLVRPPDSRRRLAVAGFALLLLNQVLVSVVAASGFGLPASSLGAGLPSWSDELVNAVLEIAAAVGLVLIAIALGDRSIRWRERAMPLVLLLVVLEVIGAVLLGVAGHGSLVAQLAEPVVLIDGALVGLLLVLRTVEAKVLPLAGFAVILIAALVDLARKIDFWVGGGMPTLFPVGSPMDLTAGYGFVAGYLLAIAAGIVLLLLAVLRTGRFKPTAEAQFFL